MSAETVTETKTAGVQHPTGVLRGTDLPGGRYLSGTETAAELGIGERAVNLAVARGRMLAVEVGGFRLIPAAEVAHYRDTRGPGRGHTNAALAAQRRAAEKTVKPKALTEWKRLRINYRLTDGRAVLINRTQADILELVDSYREPPLEGLVVDAVHRVMRGAMTRARVVALIARLIQYGLIQPLAARDAKGGAVRVLRLGVNGRAALRYCRDRGLI